MLSVVHRCSVTNRIPDAFQGVEDDAPVSSDDEWQGEHVPDIPTGVGQERAGGPVGRAVGLVLFDVNLEVVADNLTSAV